MYEDFSQDFFNCIYEKGYFLKKIIKQLYDFVVQCFFFDCYVCGICYYCGYEDVNGDQCDYCGKMIDVLLFENLVSMIMFGQLVEVCEMMYWYLKFNDFEIMLKCWLELKEGIWCLQVLNFVLGQIKQGLFE